jgi:3-dehydroquinate dehydratase / shikimate dehydrogenase
LIINFIPRVNEKMIVISLGELNKKIVHELNSYNKIVELRLDLLNELEKKLPLIKKIRPPLIATLRKKSHGGEFEGSEEERFFFFKKILHFFDYVDLENDSPVYFFDYLKNNHPKIKIILSYHNFEKSAFELNLEEIFSKMEALKPNIIKMVTLAKSSLDALKMVIFVKKKAEMGHLISGLCLGEKGSLTRLLSPIVKGHFSYCKLGKPTAVGQFSLEEMERRYGYNYLNEKSTIYALIGKDVSKSPSHITHNKIFSSTNFKSLYVKIPLETDELSSFFELIKELPFQGLSVTSPYKIAILPFLDEMEKEIQAVNTLVKQGGKWVGYNTDGKAALDAIEKKVLVKNKNILVLGAGGSSRAICFEAKKRGAKVRVLNRDEKKAKTLACHLGIEGFGLDFLPKIICEEGYDILINATSSVDPIAKEYILPKKLVMDINYLPHPTPFLIKAREAGSLIIFGFEMFVYQAKGQFKIWSQKTFIPLLK